MSDRRLADMRRSGVVVSPATIKLYDAGKTRAPPLTHNLARAKGVSSHLGTVDAPDAKSAVEIGAKAME